jgi:hypothetical protein
MKGLVAIPREVMSGSLFLVTAAAGTDNIAGKVMAAFGLRLNVI